MDLESWKDSDFDGFVTPIFSLLWESSPAALDMALSWRLGAGNMPDHDQPSGLSARRQGTWKSGKLPRSTTVDLACQGRGYLGN